MTDTPDHQTMPALAARIEQDRTWLTESLFRVIESARRAGGASPVADLAEADRFARANVATAVDLLARWTRTGDPDVLTLFIGWLNLCANERLNTGQPADFSAPPLEETWQSWIDRMRTEIPDQELQAFHSGLIQVTQALRRPAERQLRMLVVGDCLLDDVMASLHGPCVKAGISLALTTLAHRVPASLRNEIRKLESRKFDLVFFSPFSHEFSSEYTQAIGPQRLLRSNGDVDSLLDAAFRETAAAIDLLAEQFECPIYVHNTGTTLQHKGDLKGTAKLALTSLRRKRARERLNPAVADLVATRNASSFEHLFVLDEAALLDRFDAFDLGRIWFDSGMLHPTLLGSVLGREAYFRAVYTQAFLSSRKVIVCDLDNTLWEGVIGEGDVRHLHERQQVVRGLREKGLVLAINSKNDPEKVHWTGATLSEDDFVCAQINWGLKTQNIKRIRDELNLKVKDFIFLDDRADERSQVKDAFPEIHVMDASDPETWALLEHWRRVLPSQVDEDRTRMYRERVERERFVADIEPVAGEQEDAAAAFMALELKVLIREAQPSDMKRVAELINRTNQFNLCGSRTSVRELSSGLGRDRRIILAEARDKFGSMGTVGIIVADSRGQALEIPIFVLSCRAFGFGIECAMLNALKRRVEDGDEIVGHFRETTHNKPCHSVYPDAGFEWDGQFWRGRRFVAISDPAWLTVETSLPDSLSVTRPA